MPTPPFSSNFVARLAEPTAWRFENSLGLIFTPRFFCCTNPNDLGLSAGKLPTAVIELSPSLVFVGETVNYAGTLSYDPDGSITAYAWTFEGHTPASGTASSGTLNYGTAGFYDIQLIVTDGTANDSAPARVQLMVLPAQFSGFVATTTGVFYSDGTSPVTWTGKNTGLSGDDLIEYDVIIDPATQNLSDSEKVVWRCGVSNVWVSINGGGAWTEKTPSTITNSWGDAPTPTIADLTFRQLLFVGSRLFCMATWQNGASAWRSRIFYTDNAGDIREDTSATVAWTEII